MRVAAFVRRAAWIAVLSLVVSSAVAAAETIAAVDATEATAGVTAIRERLAQPQVLRGEFTQQKRLAGFRNPLRSNGNFVLARERGIVWRTLAPFASTTVVTAERVLSRLPDGSERVELDAAAQPALGAVNALLFSVFAGDLDALSARFALTPTLLDAQQWKLDLVPKPGALADLFVGITLRGDGFVREVRIEERGGDVTEIVFDALVDTPATLHDDEARQFE